MKAAPEPGSEGIPDERPQRRREYSGGASTLGVAALIVLTVGAAIWFLEFRGDTGGSDHERGLGIVELAAALNPTGQPPAAREGRAAPDFRLKDPDGGHVVLSSLRGKYTLVNFWASWCGPCRAEAPDLEVLATQHADRITVVGVNQQETAGDARAFAQQFSISYPIALDITGEVSEAYRVGRGLPVSFLVSPDGVVVKTYLGRLTSSDIAALVSEYLP